MAIKNYSTKAKESKKDELNYKVIEKYGKLSDAANPKEVRLISWNDDEPKYDIRPWKELEDGTERCFKGLTFTAEELENLLEILQNLAKEEE